MRNKEHSTKREGRRKRSRLLVTLLFLGISGLLVSVLATFMIFGYGDSPPSAVNQDKAPPVANNPPAQYPPPGKVRRLPANIQDVAVDDDSDADATGDKWEIVANPIPASAADELNSWRVVLSTEDTAKQAASANGDAVQFRGVEPGVYNLQVRADGWVAADLSGVEYGGEFRETTLDLYRLGVIRVRVRDEFDRPVPDLSVVLDHEGEILMPYIVAKDRDVSARVDEWAVAETHTRLAFPLAKTTDKQGFAVFSNLPPGPRYRAMAGSNEFATARVNRIGLPPGNTRTVDVSVNSGAFITGTVLGGDGDPLQRAEVRAFRLHNSEQDSEYEVKQTGTVRARGWIQEQIVRANADGTFRVGPLPPGPTRIRVDNGRNATEGMVAHMRHGAEKYAEWLAVNATGVGVRLSAEVALRAGEERDIGVLRPEHPPIELVFMCNGFEQPEDLHITASPMVDHSNPESTIDVMSEYGMVALHLGSCDRAVIENLPPCNLNVSVTSLSGRIEPHHVQFEGVGERPMTFDINLDRAGAKEPTVDLRAIPDPVPANNDNFFAIGLIQPREGVPAVRYLSHGPGGSSVCSVIKSMARNKAINLFDERKARDGYILWMTNGDRTAVRRIDVADKGGERVAIEIPLNEEAGACEFRVTSADGTALKNAVVAWFWDSDHMSGAAHLPYLRETTDAEGMAMLRGFPTRRNDFPRVEHVFRISADGYKSKVLRTFGGTASNPTIEKVSLTKS